MSFPWCLWITVIGAFHLDKYDGPRKVIIHIGYRDWCHKTPHRRNKNARTVYIILWVCCIYSTMPLAFQSRWHQNTSNEIGMALRYTVRPMVRHYTIHYEIVHLTIMARVNTISRVSCQKGPTRHAYAWQVGPFWQDTIDMRKLRATVANIL